MLRALRFLCIVCLVVPLMAAVSVTVAPKTVSLAGGATQQFTATVAGATNTAVTWTCTGGAISTSGLYTAPTTAGAYTVKATSAADRKKSSTATVTVTAAAAVAVAISPATASLSPNATQQFTATVTGTTNTAVNWSCTGGSIDANGLYTAPSTAGTYTVNATSAFDATKSASSTVTVTAPALSVAVSPATVFINTNATQQFTATVTGATNTAVNWTCTGGSISASGLYMAPAAAGIYAVTATSVADGAKYHTVNVTVAVPVTISIYSEYASVYTSAPVQFRATVEGASNPAVVWSCTSGSISASGLYTAPSSAGTYVVKATSVENPAIQALCPIEVMADTSTEPKIYRIEISKGSPAPGEPVQLTAWFKGTGTMDHGVGTVSSSVPVTVSSSVHTFYRLDVKIGGNSVSGGSWILPAINSQCRREIVNGTFPYNQGMGLTWLPSGKILMSGGDLTTDQPASNLDIFDPSTFTVTHMGSMSTPRANHSTQLLTDGNVLIVGRDTWEVVNPDSGMIMASGALPGRAYLASLTLLLDGRVLIAGGCVSDPLSPHEDFQIFDPCTMTCQWAGNAPEPIYGPATLLPDGRVLIVTGHLEVPGDFRTLVKNGMIYDPLTNQISVPKARGLDSSLMHGSAARLIDGRVLIAGSKCVIFDPIAMTTTIGGDSCADKLYKGPGGQISGGWNDGYYYSEYSELVYLEKCKSGIDVFNASVTGFCLIPITYNENNEEYSINARSISNLVLPMQGKTICSTWLARNQFEVINTNLELYLDAISLPLKKGYSRSFKACGPLGGSVIWSVQEAGGGSITQDGKYTAPSTKGIFHVVATSTSNPAVKAYAEVLVIDTVQEISSALITGFSASATKAVYGESITLTASFQGGTGAIDQGVGPVESGVPVTVTVSGTKTFTLTVTDPSGMRVATKIQIQVAPLLHSFTVDKTTIGLGETIIFNASFTGGTGNIEGVGSIASGVPLTFIPTQTGTFTLVVTGPDGVALTASVYVVVKPSIQVFAPRTGIVPAGTAVTFDAAWQGAEYIEVSDFFGTYRFNGPSPISFVLYPLTTTLYTMTVVNASGTTTAYAAVQVMPVFQLSPSAVELAPGGQAVFECTTNSGAVSWTATAGTFEGIGYNPAGGKFPIIYTAPDTPGEYLVTATSTIDSSIKSTSVVTVRADQPPVSGTPTVSFTASTQASVLPGTSVTLSWEVVGATQIQISGMGEQAATGSATVTPNATTNYTLQAINGVGTTTRICTVRVAGSLVWKSDKIYGFGQLISEDTAGTSGTATTYIHSDQVGSPNWVTDASGAPAGSSKNLPFGERFVANGAQSSFRYAGHEDQPGSPVYMQARMFLPAYGRFGSPDPAYDQNAEDTQSWNLYGYVRNNPITNTDPTGMFGVDDAWSYTKESAYALKGYGIGIGKTAVGVATGVAHMVAHPIQTTKGIGQALANPLDTAKGIGGAVSNAWNNANTPQEMGEFFGRAAGEAALVVAPFAKGGQAASLGKSGGVADIVVEGRQAAGLAEQIVMKDAQAGGGRVIMEGPFADMKFEAEGWVKKAVNQSTTDALGNKKKIEVHYMENVKTSERTQFKFKNEPIKKLGE